MAMIPLIIRNLSLTGNSGLFFCYKVAFFCHWFTLFAQSLRALFLYPVRITTDNYLQISQKARKCFAWHAFFI
jgi:hypothetical protein